MALWNDYPELLAEPVEKTRGQVEGATELIGSLRARAEMDSAPTDEAVAPPVADFAPDWTLRPAVEPADEKLDDLAAAWTVQAPAVQEAPPAPPIPPLDLEALESVGRLEAGGFPAELLAVAPPAPPSPPADLEPRPMADWYAGLRDVAEPQADAVATDPWAPEAEGSEPSLPPLESLATQEHQHVWRRGDDDVIPSMVLEDRRVRRNRRWSPTKVRAGH